ncbi:MAG: DUF2325 domain-containing protein [Deltaproteobacteria bacterium]|jgi:hypothetical protein|nr:DUF2325 domain-containing protein [Deltaproteobacteria bacterium]
MKSIRKRRNGGGIEGGTGAETRGIAVSGFSCKECPAFDFCRKRVLMVGGIDRMERRYRELVETCGGTFEHHTGVMKNGGRKLKNSMLRADVVLCPIRCNSHAACGQVKKLGKKLNKPVYMLANFSLNALSQVGRPTPVDSATLY